MKLKSLIIISGLFFTYLSSSAQSKDYLLKDADNYFKTGRYWDAFFLYRDIAKIPEFQGNFQVENQIKNSSRAMYLWKKTEDYRAFKKYEIAKTHLSELLVINPEDPNRGLLPRLTLEEASNLQRIASARNSSQEAADLLKRAVQLYHLAIEEGLKDEMVFSLIKQCEFALEKNKYGSATLPTSYGINYEKDKERQERQRNIEILKKEI